MPRRQYETYMSLGEHALDRGKIDDALNNFGIAIADVHNKLEVARVQQMKGVALRMRGDLDYSEDYLRRALRVVEQLGEDHHGLLSRIKRDLAMTLMERLKPGDSMQLFIILGLLSDSLQAFSEDDPEYWATVGFIGRAYLLYGEVRDAFMRMREADLGFQQASVQHPTYELNNLVWMMCAAGRRRGQYLQRALQLVGKTGQTRRYPELALIMAGGGRLYQLVRQLRIRR